MTTIHMTEVQILRNPVFIPFISKSSFNGWRGEDHRHQLQHTLISLFREGRLDHFSPWSLGTKDTLNG